MNLSEIQPRPVVCRQSTITCALGCERRWWYRYRMGIALRGEQRKESADLGTIYHRLQHLGPGSEQQVKAEIVKQQHELMDRVSRGEDLDGEITRKATVLTELYNKAVVMAQIFWERYPHPSYFKVIGTEIKHSMEWNGLILEGTIDKLLVDKTNIHIWIRDHKSTGRSLEVLFGGVAWGLQGRLYRILAGDYIEKLEPVSYDRSRIRGFILDGILKPGIKLCKTDQKNAKEWNVPVEEAYLRRVKTWYAEKEEDTIRSRSILFAEPLFPAELKHNLTYMGILSMADAHHPARFHRDVSGRACFEYEKQCVYHDLCSTDPKQWDQLFEKKYKVEPLEEDKQ